MTPNQKGVAIVGGMFGFAVVAGLVIGIARVVLIKQPAGVPRGAASAGATLPLDQVYRERDREQENIDRCRLSIPGTEYPVPLFPTEQGLREYTEASSRGLTPRDIAVIADANGAFEVHRGSRCSLLDPGIVRSRVRVLHGEHAGRAGWVLSEWHQGR